MMKSFAQARRFVDERTGLPRIDFETSGRYDGEAWVVCPSDSAPEGLPALIVFSNGKLKKLTIADRDEMWNLWIRSEEI